MIHDFNRKATVRSIVAVEGAELATVRTKADGIVHGAGTDNSNFADIAALSCPCVPTFDKKWQT